MRLLAIVLVFIGFSLSASASGGAPAYIFESTTRQPLNEVYQNLYESLEDSRFYVIFEANIGKNLARNADAWGEAYNRNKFDGIRSMVICNPWYANQVMNLDPKMMAMCPMTVTLLHKKGETTVLFERLTPIASGSPAEDVLWEVENIVISAIESVM